MIYITKNLLLFIITAIVYRFIGLFSSGFYKMYNKDNKDDTICLCSMLCIVGIRTMRT